MSLVLVLRQCCPHRRSWEVFCSPWSVISMFPCLHLDSFLTRLAVLICEYLSVLFKCILQLLLQSFSFWHASPHPEHLLLFKFWGHTADQMHRPGYSAKKKVHVSSFQVLDDFSIIDFLKFILPHSCQAESIVRYCLTFNMCWAVYSIFSVQPWQTRANNSWYTYTLWSLS